jgi:ribonuclease HII
MAAKRKARGAGGRSAKGRRPARTAAKPKPRGRKPLVYGGVALRCTCRFEDEARAEGHLVVAGLDEVGRGALCGPVVAGVAILGDGFDTDGIDDSKRLTARQRERLGERIREHALAWALGFADVEEIDRLNILRATHLAMCRALAALKVRPDLVLVDGKAVADLGVKQRAIVKGDALSVSIAAASIVAKVARDGIMRECDGRFPGYGLAENAGYASEAHRDAIRRLGPSAIHRRSFADMDQLSLF